MIYIIIVYKLSLYYFSHKNKAYYMNINAMVSNYVILK